MREISAAWIYLIGSQILMLTIRKRFTNELFPHTHISKHRSLLIGGALAGLALLLYPHLIQWIFSQHAADYLYSSLTIPFGRQRIGTLSIYLLIPVGVLAILLRHEHTHLTVIVGSYIICILILLIAQQINNIAIGWLVFGYLLIAATSEEFLKLLNTTHLFASTSPLLLNDLLPLSLLSAYGFARLENIVYLAGHLIPGVFSETFLSLLIGRGIFGFLLHGIFSGTIALLLQKHLKFSPGKGLLFGLLLGIGLHFTYNALLTYNIGRGIIIYMILAYTGTTYFLYNSHRLYVPQILK